MKQCTSRMLIVAALISLSIAQKNVYAHSYTALASTALASAALMGAAYLEYKSIEDETSEKTWNRAGCDAAAVITTPIWAAQPLLPVNFVCLYNAVNGENWGKRLFYKIGAGTLGITALAVGLAAAKQSGLNIMLRVNR